MRERIEKIVEEKVKPMLAMDRGSVEVIEITEDNVVRVKLTGACAGCPMAQMTLLNVIERTIKSQIPEVKKVTL